ncbi:MAG: CoA transferase [Actinomycetia bacterium]|nr:CoA transferase [Actinomycetes bacterium]MCP4222578.1 CoA transferase [Actinomycetes bacterium]MCP5031727.1 CoA transferase [Actinomycetes bacterium]
MSGPLSGVKVVELAGIGPGPMCAMLLSDLGAEVIRVDRPVQVDLGIERGRKFNVLNRGRRSIAVDLKSPEGIEVVLGLVEQADALIEGFRPGVTERLGLGPDVCHARNPRLVYGRMTGWGQDGPMAHAAGHDINYIALTGVLDAIGNEGGSPVPPLNLVGDFGGGALYLALGVCAGLLEARQSGQGQVIDAAMVDGAASLLSAIYGLYGSGDWSLDRGTNLLDTGAHFYGTYECSDGGWISIGSIEGKFHAELMEKLGLDPSGIPDRMDRTRWKEYKKQLTGIFLDKTRAEWCEIMEGSDVCFAPVLSMAEAPEHPHNAERGTFVEVEGVVQPGPAPRFSRTPGRIQGPVPDPGQHTDDIMADWGWSEEKVAELRSAGAFG